MAADHLCGDGKVAVVLVEADDVFLHYFRHLFIADGGETLCELSIIRQEGGVFQRRYISRQALFYYILLAHESTDPVIFGEYGHPSAAMAEYQFDRPFYCVAFAEHDLIFVHQFANFQATFPLPSLHLK